MQRNDLLFLALMTALAAIASAQPPPPPAEQWSVVEAASTSRSEQMQALALEISLAPIP